MIRETTEMIVQIKNRLLAARSWQKSYADVRRKPLEFETVVATSSTEAEYVAAASNCAQVLWIQNYKELASPKQTALGKDISNPFMADGIGVTAGDLKLMLLGILLLLKKVAVSEDVIRRDLHLHDTDRVECLPNGEIFLELARMGYEKPHLKLTFTRRSSLHNGKEEEVEIPNAPTPPSPTNDPSPPSQDPTPTPHATPYASPSQEQPTSPYDFTIPLLNTLMKTCASLSQKVAELEHDNHTQALEILNLKKRGMIIQKEVNATIKGVSTDEPTVFDDEENMARYKMEHFRGMTYDKVRPIFKREYKKVQTLFKPDKDVEEPQKKRVAEKTLLQESFMKLKVVEVSVSEFKVEALQVKYHIIDWEIHTEGSRTYWKIIRVGGITDTYQSFEDMLKGFDREDLVALWNLVKEKFSTTVPNVDKEKALWVELKRLFEPDADDVLWKLQRKNYPLSNVFMTLMLSVKLQVEEDNEIVRDLVMKIFMANKPKSRSFDTSSK
nr:hypothetical protein [Tanacetum cinerariifolium]